MTTVPAPPYCCCVPVPTDGKCVYFNSILEGNGLVSTQNLCQNGFEHFIMFLLVYLNIVYISAGYTAKSDSLTWLSGTSFWKKYGYFMINLEQLLHESEILLDSLLFGEKKIEKRNNRPWVIAFFVFFIDFLRMRFRGFEFTLSAFSQGWVELLNWNFQGSFQLW